MSAGANQAESQKSGKRSSRLGLSGLGWLKESKAGQLPSPAGPEQQGPSPSPALPEPQAGEPAGAEGECAGAAQGAELQQEVAPGPELQPEGYLEIPELNARTVKRMVRNSAAQGCRPGERRAAFIVNERLWEMVRSYAYWERLEIKEVMSTALVAFLQDKKIRPLPQDGGE